MKLIDIIQRDPKPAAWSGGDNIPWNEPGFSERMLKEHLTQDHDAASRKFETIDAHVRWIHQDLLGGRPVRILDLGCGPGLYAQRLAKLGHAVTGIDYGPASVRYARETAAREGLDCTYQLADLREADFGQGFDLVMQIYGEINVFKPADADLILRKAYAALQEGGLILLEVEDFAAVKREGQVPPGWFASQAGLFSEQPYVYLSESFWDEEAQAAVERIYIIDAATGEVSPMQHSVRAYSDAAYEQLMERAGFRQVQFYPAMGPDLTETRGNFFPVLACKLATE